MAKLAKGTSGGGSEVWSLSLASRLAYQANGWGLVLSGVETSNNSFSPTDYLSYSDDDNDGNDDDEDDDDDDDDDCQQNRQLSSSGGACASGGYRNS
ncbi:hypothetical protein CDD83_7502 [Cordyceps sp. RAO-2017]|nr:hypothetical protein CDD83_7502 [Cordyceps sp. RAO-2017]